MRRVRRTLRGEGCVEACPIIAGSVMTLATLVVFFAVSGYVDDVSCASCHANIVRTYQHVGMSKSFYRPRQSDAIEDFAKLPFRHARSGDVMELRWRNGRLVFRRWAVAGTENPVYLFEQPVDWILGSGHHARTYLYQTPNGELYQLPLAWYTQTHEWGMEPGYDRRDHEGVLRRARAARRGQRRRARRDRQSGATRCAAPQRRLLRVPHAAVGRDPRHPPLRPRHLFISPRPGAARLPAARRHRRRRDPACRSLRDQPSSISPRAEPLLPRERREAVMSQLSRSASQDGGRFAGLLAVSREGASRKRELRDVPHAEAADAGCRARGDDGPDR